MQIQKQKKESLLVGLFVLVVIAIVGVIGYNIIMMEFNPKYNVGTIYNDHIKSCVVKNKKIDCGPLVTNMKYKLDDNSYVELTKEDKSIKVDVKNYKSIDVCYKTKDTDYKCLK